MNTDKFIRKLHSFCEKKDGNFTVMAALLVPLCFMAGSIAIDLSSAYSMKAQVQNAADGAALATASQLAQKKIAEADAKAYAENFFKGIMAQYKAPNGGFTATPTATVTPLSTGVKAVWEVKVSSQATQKLSPLAKFIGKDTITVAVSGTSQSGRDASNPMSMMLILDHSGSMAWASGQKTTYTTTDPVYCTRQVITGYILWFPIYGTETYQCGTKTTTHETDVPKIQVLKDAVTDLVNYVKGNDPDNKYARMGAVSFNDQVLVTDQLAPVWTKDLVKTFTQALVAVGGTNTYNPMKYAYDKITSPTEINEHFSKNGTKTPSKFIVFMTDGQNDTGNATDDTYYTNQTKYYCDQAKANKVVVFSVAFQAPDAGKTLLKACASAVEYYYDANSASDLLNAFKDIGEQATKLTTRLTQ